MSSTIEEALATVQTPQGDKEKINTDLKQTRALRDYLYGAEATMRKELDARAHTLQQDLDAITIANRLGVEPRILSPEVFRWRHDKKGTMGIPIPKLAYLPITGDTVKIIRNGLEPQRASDVVSLYYNDVSARLREIHMSDNPFNRNLWRTFPTLTFTFKGMIPASTRAKIIEACATGSFSQQDVALVVETGKDDWQYSDTKRHLRRELSDAFADPIVVAHSAGRLWVIDVFDPTTLEQYIASEFAPKQLTA